MSKTCSMLRAVGIPLVAGTLAALPRPVTSEPPNVVIIFTDDQGYGDLGCYGHPTLRTPEIDRMAAEGLRFTDFYAAAPVCTPSRAALLTGRYDMRVLPELEGRVLFPNSREGLPQSEITLARLLQAAGYATAHLGKWHLGIHPGQRPIDHGFDYSFELPYSNDMDRRPDLPAQARFLPNPPVDGWNVPLLRNGEVIERPVDQRSITRRLTEEAVSFIQANRDHPFLIYLAHPMPHTPLFRSEPFRGVSPRGLYGDVIEELDWSTGVILQTLRDLGLDRTTLVIYTSDNGPWLSEQEQGGSAGLLRAGKGTTWEGGMRVPGIFWMPGRISPGNVTSEMASTLDVFPTVLAMAGIPLPEDRIYDGMDLGPLLFDEASLPERLFFYYRAGEIFACRMGPWKAHFITRGGAGAPEPREAHDPPLLYHLWRDPSERFNRADLNPEVIVRIEAALEAHRATFKDAD